MTVGELIKELAKCDFEKTVMVSIHAIPAGKNPVTRVADFVDRPDNEDHIIIETLWK